MVMLLEMLNDISHLSDQAPSTNLGDVGTYCSHSMRLYPGR